MLPTKICVQALAACFDISRHVVGSDGVLHIHTGLMYTGFEKLQGPIISEASYLVADLAIVIDRMSACDAGYCVVYELDGNLQFDYLDEHDAKRRFIVAAIPDSRYVSKDITQQIGENVKFKQVFLASMSRTRRFEPCALVS